MKKKKVKALYGQKEIREIMNKRYEKRGIPDGNRRYVIFNPNEFEMLADGAFADGLDVACTNGKYLIHDTNYQQDISKIMVPENEEELFEE